MWPRSAVIKQLQQSIFKVDDEIDRLSEPCKKHDLANHPEADACPCVAKLFWQRDRLDESIERLKSQGHSVARWILWYIWSSPKVLGFPKESINGWSQIQPIAAWQKYGIAMRNSEADQRGQRGYVYYKDGREVRTRPAAGPLR